MSNTKKKINFYREEDVICKRIEIDTNFTKKIMVNVPHEITRKSPTGFEWGYGGSGPSDLALNILYDFTKNKDIAVRIFKNIELNIFLVIIRVWELKWLIDKIVNHNILHC